MLDKFVANLLTSYLGKYIANLDKQHVKVSVWNGYVVLHDLQLKPNALRYMDLPVCVKEGVIGELSVTIPWTKLQSESVKVEIKNVVLMVHPKKASAYDEAQEEQDAWERKEEELAVYEALRKADPAASKTATADDAAATPEEGGDGTPDPDAAKDNTFAARLKATMLNNLQVKVTNVLLQYEDLVTHPEAPIALTARIGSFTVASTDHEYRPSFTSPKSKFFFKLVQLNEFSLYIESLSKATPTTGSSTSSSSPKQKISGRTCQEIVSLAYFSGNNSSSGGGSDNSSSSLTYVVKPVNFSLKLQHQPIPYQPSIPRWLGTVEIAHTVVQLNRNQWDAVWRSVKYVQRFEQYEAFLQFRPSAVTVSENPRAWWQFAINSVLFVLRKERRKSRFDWQKYVELKANEREYLLLHVKKQQPSCPWMIPMTTSETLRHEQLERRMPIESIKIARSLAYARVNLEAEQHSAREQYIAKKALSSGGGAATAVQGQGQKKGGGWWAWWTGATTTASTLEEPVANSDDEQREIDKLWGMLDADRWTAEQRKVLAKEFGFSDETTTTTSDSSPMQASPKDNTLVLAHAKTIEASLLIHSVFLELLDYDGRAFANFSMERLCAAVKKGATGEYELWTHVYDFSLNDAVGTTTTATPATRGDGEYDATIKGPSSTSIHSRAIVRVARERLPSQWLRHNKQTTRDAAGGSSLRRSAGDAWFTGFKTDWIPNDVFPGCDSAIRGRYIATRSGSSSSSSKSSNFVVSDGSPASASSLPNHQGEHQQEFELDTEVLPIDVCASIPWMQRLVAFWGVDTKLVDSTAFSSSTPASKAATSSSTLGMRSSPNAKTPPTKISTSPSAEATAAAAVDQLREQMTVLIALVERTPLTKVRCSVQELCFVVPEEEDEQECRVHVERVLITNDYTKAASRKLRLSSELVADTRMRSAMRRKSRRILIHSSETAASTEAAAASSTTTTTTTTRTRRSSVFLYGSDADAAAELDAQAEDEEEDRKESVLFRHVQDDDWVDNTVIVLTNLSIFTAWRGAFDAALLQDVSATITLRRSLVKQKHDVPLLAVECLFPTRLIFESPLEGYAVFFSAMTAMTDFMNNASGRGTLNSKAKDAGVHHKEEFSCTVVGPRLAYVIGDEPVLTPQQAYFAPLPTTKETTRVVEVSRGCLTLFHEKRPSMPFAKLELKPNAFQLVRQGAVLHVFVQRGGKHHIVREHLMATREYLAEKLSLDVNTLVQIPMPQLQFLIGEYSQRHASTMTEDDRDELLGCFAVLDESAKTVPCQCVSLSLPSEKDARRLEHVVARSTAPEGMPSSTVTVADAQAVVAERQQQPSIVDLLLIFQHNMHFKIRPRNDSDCVLGAASALAPTFVRQTTTNGFLDVELSRVKMHMALTVFTRHIHASMAELTVRARDELRTVIVGEASNNVSPPAVKTHKDEDGGADANDENDLTVVMHFAAASSSPAAAATGSNVPLGATTLAEDVVFSDGVFITFDSSWLPLTTPLTSIHCEGETSITLDDHCAAATELLWDLLGVMTMKQYGVTSIRALQWETTLQEQRVNNEIAATEETDRIVVELECKNTVSISMTYEHGGMEVNGHVLPVMPKGTQAKLRGKSLSLRWRNCDLVNQTSLWLEDPCLETYFKHKVNTEQENNSSTAVRTSPYIVFLAPRTDDNNFNNSNNNNGESSSLTAEESLWMSRQASSATISRASTSVFAAAATQQKQKPSSPPPPPTSPPLLTTPTKSHVLFEYSIHYPPQGISECEWRESTPQRGSQSGFHYTHFMSVIMRRVFCRYWQQDLWSLIEYFTNGLVSRLAFIASRKPFAINERQHTWPPSKDVPKSSYSTAMLHKHIDILDCVLCLPHDAFAAPQLWASCERMSMWDRIGTDRRPLVVGVQHDQQQSLDGTQACNPSGESPPLLSNARRCEVRTGFAMTFEGLSLWAAKPLSGQHRVVTSDNFNEEDVWYRDPDFTDAIVKELSLEYFMWFDAACMLKEASQKTLGFKTGELHFHGSSEQLSLLLDWVTGVFIKNPWRPLYPQKSFAAVPFPNLALRDGKPCIMYDYDIQMDRLMLHLRDPAISYLATASKDGPTIDRQPINVVVDLQRAVIALQWLSDESFYSRYAVESLDGWDLLRTSWKTSNCDFFVKSPREVVSAQQQFIKLAPSSGSTSSSSSSSTDVFALDVVFGWKQRASAAENSPLPSEKIVYSTVNLGSMEIDVIPKFIFDVRDSLLSLRVRNAFAPLCRWPQTIPFRPAAPWDPKTQEWKTQHTVAVSSLTLVFFDLTSRRPKPTFYVALQDVKAFQTTSKYRASSQWGLSVQRIAQNGVCDDAFRGKPVIVPQSGQQSSNSNNNTTSSSYASRLGSSDGGSSWETPSHVNALVHEVVSAMNENGPNSGGGYDGELYSAATSNANANAQRVVTSSSLSELPLVAVSFDSTRGMSGYFGCVWIFAPLKEQLRRLQATFTDEGLKELSLIGTYTEERYAVREGLYPPPSQPPVPSADAADNASYDIRFVVFHPCLVISEHESIVSDQVAQRGVVLNWGLLEFNSTFVSSEAAGQPSTSSGVADPSPSGVTTKKSFASRFPNRQAPANSDRNDPTNVALSTTTTTARRNRSEDDLATRIYRFQLTAGHMRSLHRGSQHLIKPMNISLQGARHMDGTIDLRAKLDGLMIDIAMEYYESVLRSIVRHFLLNEDEIVEQRFQAAAAAAAAASQRHGSDGVSVRSAGRSSATGFTVSKSARLRRASIAATMMTNESDVSPQGTAVGSSGATAAAGGTTTSAKWLSNINVTVEWECVCLRVYNDSIAVSLAIGKMTFEFDKTEVPRIQNEVDDTTKGSPRFETSLTAPPLLHFSDVPACDSTTVAPTGQESTMNASNSGVDSEDGVRDLLKTRTSRQHTQNGGAGSNSDVEPQRLEGASGSDTTPAATASPIKDASGGSGPDTTGAAGGTPLKKKRKKSSSVRRRRPPPAMISTTSISATLHYLRLGVEGQRPLLCLECADVGDAPVPDGRNSTTAADTSGSLPLTFDFDQVDDDYKLFCDLGITRIELEHDSVVNAISFLYEPYRRIVLPRYTAFEVKEVSDDFTLIQRLLLSSRSILRVRSTEKNHITLNANGHPIHFLDSGKALIVLDSGVTLHIVGATVYLYGKPLDHYVKAGNGSYVVLDDQRCDVIPGIALLHPDHAGGDGEEDDDDEEEAFGGAEDLTSVKTFQVGERVPHTMSILWVPRDINQQMAIKAAFFFLVPEHRSSATTNNNNDSSVLAANSSNVITTITQQQMSSNHVQRALMLSAGMTFAWSKLMVNGDVSETGVFDLTELEAECQYLTRSGMRVDYSSLISPWDLRVDIISRQDFQQATMRTIRISAAAGVDLRFRYGDVQLSLSALNHATAALGHIESNVIATAATIVEPHEFAALDQDDDAAANQDQADGGGGKKVKKSDPSSKTKKNDHLPVTVSIETLIPRIGVYLVDDSSSMDFPLFYLSIENIRTPVYQTVGISLKSHVCFSVHVEYYNFHGSVWSRLLEPVRFDVVMRDQPNRSLQDVQARKGFRRAGVRVSNVRLHFTPMAADAVSRTMRLVSKLQKTSEGVAASPTSTTTNIGGAGSSSTAFDNTTTTTTTSLEFFAYEITQQLGPDVKISFAEDDKGRFPAPHVLQMLSTYPFNFPRIEGRELPASQHYVIVTTENTQLLRISRVGLQVLTLQFGGIEQDVIADIQVRDGKKRVTLRTNIAFENRLPFPISLGGVGSVFANSSQTVPTEAMRRRCIFVPQLPYRCHEVSMGVPYDALPNHYSQTFLCTSEIDEYNSSHYLQQQRGGTGSASTAVTSTTVLQRAVYILLLFAPKLKVSDQSNMYDCRAVFEAPFTIINNTGLPITAGLLYKQYQTKAKTGLLDFSEKYYFVKVASIQIDSEESAPITQVDPLTDVFMDVTFVQQCGTPVGRSGAKRQSNPALIRSQKKQSRDATLVLNDPNGETIVLRIEYADRQVIISSPFWIVNQTPHFIDIMDSNPKRKGHRLCGMAGDGLGPSPEPFIFGSEKMDRLGDKAHIYVRVGRRTTSSSNTTNTKNGSNNANALMWSQWSDAILVHPIGEWSFFHCGETESVSLSYSISFVGGNMKDTRVICITPRWILINRTPLSINIRQIGIRWSDEEENGPLGPSQSRILDVASPRGDNAIQLRLAQVAGEMDRCQWSNEIPIEIFGDHDLNMRYEQVLRDPNTGLPLTTRRESLVIRVSSYRRGSILFVAVEKAAFPPYIIENRTSYLVHVKQRDAQAKLVVYPRVTKGFVWDDSKEAPVLNIWATEGANAASRAVSINLEASLLIKRTKFQLQQEMILPGGVILYVRVRALSGSFAISVCTDHQIDKMRMLPFYQFQYKLSVESLHALISSATNDVMLLSITPIDVSMVQQASPSGEDDEQIINVSTSVVQIDDERPNAVERVVLQLVDGRPTTLKLHRRMQRLTPIIHVMNLEFLLQPIQIHMEDSFLFAVLRLVESFQQTLSGQERGDAKKSRFDVVPWAPEVDANKVKNAQGEESIQNKIAFIERLLIEQIVLSLSLYRAHDAATDPIRERLGVLSVMIRSVQDARVDWRRVEQANIYDKIWLLGTLYSNFYMHTLQQQMLNVLHIAGLDVMRGFVTDLLQQYFSSTVTTHIDRNRLRLPRRAMAHFLEDAEREVASGAERAASPSSVFMPPLEGGSASSMSQSHSGAWDTMDDATVISSAGRWLKFGSTNAKTLVSIEALAFQVSWNDFMEQVTNAELRTFGHHALCQAIRTRSFASPPPDSLCRRCTELDVMRQERIESGSMSVLPHPDTQLIDWSELTHHISWSEFVAICTPQEIRKYAHWVRDAVLGRPKNVIRIDGGLMWCLQEKQ